MHLFLSQDLNLTCSLEQCVQVPVKSTRTSTGAWMQWRRCRFQNQFHIQSPERFEKQQGHFLGCFSPPGVVNFIIRRQLSLHLRLPKTVLSISLLGRRCRQSCGSLPRAQPHTKNHTNAQPSPKRWWVGPSLHTHLIWKTPHLLWPYFTSCFGRLYNSYE